MKPLKNSTCLCAWVLTFTLGASLGLQSPEKSDMSSRKEKLFLVRIQNTDCRVGSANGTCYLKDECRTRGGEVIGTCQNGLGSCCKFEFTCSNVSNYRTIYEKEFTMKDSRDCEFEIIKPTGYCQIKIDIVNLYSAPGNTPDGRCPDGEMNIEDSVTVRNFPICGVPGRPLYASYGRAPRITLNFASNGGEGNRARNYEVKISQIRCDARDRVPDHCLVEYTERTGQVESFGFRTGWIAGQRYTACIRKGSSSSTIRWTKCDKSGVVYTPASGMVLGSPIPSPDFILSRIWGRIGGYGDSCLEGTSYVSIQGHTYCGNHFPNEVTSIDEPFAITVNMMQNDFTRIPDTLVVWPPFNPPVLAMTAAVPGCAAQTMAAPMFDPGTVVWTNKTTTGCTPVSSMLAAMTTADDFLFQCVCSKAEREPLPGAIETPVNTFPVGFCLEYTLT